jgi:uncharacterized Tic20 family protein
MTFSDGQQDLRIEQGAPQHCDAEPEPVPFDLTQQAHMNSSNTLAMSAHIGALLTWAASILVAPLAFFCFVVPFIIRSRWGDQPFVRHHTTQSLNSALTGLVLLGIGEFLQALPVPGPWVGVALLLLAVGRAVCEIIGVVKAHKGEQFTFPTWVAFRFIKDEAPALSRRTKVAIGAAGALAVVLAIGSATSGRFQPVDAQTVNPPSGACEFGYPLDGTNALNIELVVTYPTGNGTPDSCGVQQSELDSLSGLASVLVPGKYAKVGVAASCSGTFDGGAVAYAAFVVSPDDYSDQFCAGVNG